MNDDLEFHLACNFVLVAKRKKPESDLGLNEFMKVLGDQRYVNKGSDSRVDTLFIVQTHSA